MGILFHMDFGLERRMFYLWAVRVFNNTAEAPEALRPRRSDDTYDLLRKLLTLYVG